MLQPGSLIRWLPLSVIVAAAVLAGCTKPNPKDCSDGTCPDPSLPFCDVGGEIGGTPMNCIAVSCTPSTFAACRSDSQLTCNTEGTDYDVTQCDHGCADDVGCRLCAAGETVCSNGTVQTCDAAGEVTASQACPLGCFEDQPRCRDIDPSNGLATYLDMAAAAPDLTLVDGDNVLTDTGQLIHGSYDVDGTWLRGNNAPIDLPSSFLIAAPPGGAYVRAVVANHVQISGRILVGLAKNQINAALAIVANDRIEINGSLDFLTGGLGALSSGGVNLPGCSGGFAYSVPSSIFGGSGGGGHATAGGKGGNVGPAEQALVDGGAAGQAMGNPTLVPLRGGCEGGRDSRDPTTPVAAGGGAIQLSSRIEIAIDDGSALNLNGNTEPGDPGGYQPAYGGGAGGGILLEAPSVHIGSQARLLVNGAPGASGLFHPAAASTTAIPAMSPTCTSSDTFACSNGGNGAALDGPATDASDVPTLGNNIVACVAGSGGGGLGFIRINTTTGAYTQSSDATLSGATTTGSLFTR